MAQKSPEKHPGGRPTKYQAAYCEKIIDYFRVEPQQVEYKRTYYADGSIKSEEPVTVGAQFPTFQGFADSIGVDMSTLTEWRGKYARFSAAYSHAKELQEKIWLVNGMGGQYNAQFAQFFGKNCLGYKDKQETEHSGGITVEFVDEADTWAE